jgi:O-antigen/teichoic acid export membrane protein
MSRTKLLVENIFIYGLNSVIGKVIPLIMVPIITRLVTDTSIYGTADLLKVIAAFCAAFAGLGTYDAMFRMFFEKDDLNFKKQVCSSALFMVAVSISATGLLVMAMNRIISKSLLGSTRYAGWIVFIGVFIIIKGVGSIVAAPTRMQNKRKVFVIVNTISPIISYGVAVLLILYVDHLAGLMLGAFIASLSVSVIFFWLNRSWFHFHLIDKRLVGEMLRIGLPLMPTFLIYWVFSSFDRVMISNILGTGANGIYAVGAKMAMISYLIYAAFAGGWQYFAFSTMKDDDQTQLISRIFEYLGIISLTSVILLFPWMKMGFSMIFAGEYARAYIVAPFLFLSPLLLMLFQASSNQLLVIKKSVFITISLLAGALTNIGLNFLLIPMMGIEGAAVATLTGYSLSVLIMAQLLRKKNLLIIQPRFAWAVILTIIYFAASRTLLHNAWIPWLMVSFIISGLFAYLYRKDMQDIWYKLKALGTKKAKST